MDTSTLLSGDCLLYGKSDFFGLVTEIKTWSDAVHVEIYVGLNESVASRNGIGVNLYPFRQEQLIAVLRPVKTPNVTNAMLWFNSSAKGQKYDWKGLLCFALAVKQGSKDKMFCSEFATRWYRSAGIDVMNCKSDADRIAPGSLPMSPMLDWWWVKEGTVL